MKILPCAREVGSPSKNHFDQQTHYLSTSWSVARCSPHLGCNESSILHHSMRSVNRVVSKGVKGVYTAMIKDPFKKWDRVDIFCALLVDLGPKSSSGHMME